MLLFAFTTVALLVAGGGGEALAKHSKRPVLKPKIGWGPMTSKAARKHVTRTKWEPRPTLNRRANRTVPTIEQLKAFRRKADRNNMPYANKVNGQMKGSTDDIIEWAAWKWGMPANLMRAVAVHETWWDGTFVGDNGDSFGLFQMRRPYHCCLPIMRTSTAFNADYYGAILRSYYDGAQGWLNNEGIAEHNGRRYRAGDLWGSVQAWASGKWWIDESLPYMATVKVHMRKRTWRTDRWFAEPWYKPHN